MLKPNLDEIDVADLLELVEQGVLENLYLDYKAEGNSRTDSGRSELIEDIVAFANSFGGDLIIGAAEEISHGFDTRPFLSSPNC